MGEQESDDEPELSAGEVLAWEAVNEEFAKLVQLTRTLYELSNTLLRRRKFQQLEECKITLRQQLSRLGIMTLRPEHAAWNEVVLYNEKIRQLWVQCNQRDPHEKDRVMRQIDDLNHKRQHRLAEVNHEDCPIKVWEFAAGWVQPEDRTALQPLEPEPVQQPETLQRPETVQQSELVVTQASSTNVASLNPIDDNSHPEGNHGVPGMDLNHMDSFTLDDPQGHFDTAFQDTTSSQIYEADLPSLAAFEESLWIAPADGTAGTQLGADDFAHLQEQLQVSMPIEQVPVQSQFEPREDIDNDGDSLFSGNDDDDEVDPAPVSCQAFEEPRNLENASHALLDTQQASFEEQVIENNDCDSLFDAPDENYQSESAEESLISENNAVADVPPAIPQAVQEQHAVEGSVDDDNSPFGGQCVDVDVATGLSSDQNLNELRFNTNTGSDMGDAMDLSNSGPIAQPNHGPEAQLNPGSEALPTQASGAPAPSDQGLEAESQTADQPAPEYQAAPDAVPVEQVALAPQEALATADQSEATGGEGTEAPFTSQEFVPQEPQNAAPTVLTWLQARRNAPSLEEFRNYARSRLHHLWPNHVQTCSEMQLELFATGTEEFQQLELERYEMCLQTGQEYVVEFCCEFDVLPPNKVPTWIDNGNYLFYCLIDQAPADTQTPAGTQKPAGIIDLTGDDSISPAAAAPPSVQEGALAAPAEIVAAGEPVRTTAAGNSVVNVSETPEGEEAAARMVPKIPTLPPVDEATFAQGSASLPNNAQPLTPAQSAADGNNGTWSSDWSGQAFVDGGEPPKTPSSQEVSVMAHSVTSDNSSRATKSTGQARASKKARGKAPTGPAPGSLGSVHSAHNALNHHLSQTAQTAGHVHAPPRAGSGPVAGPSHAAQPIQQQPASHGATGKRHVGRPHKDDHELTSPRKRQLQHPDSPCAEPSEGGNKRRKKNAPAAADTTGVSQVQQHSTPEESRPAQYYGPSPDRSLDAKTWVEEHTQGGKGKKRKAPAPKKTPPPRKARKTKEAAPTAPTAPRTYRPIAPAPPRNPDHANGVQMQSRASTPMAQGSATAPSPDAQMNGNSGQMHSAAPHMQNGRSQQMGHESFQQRPQQQNPAGQQNGFTNPVQEQQQRLNRQAAWLEEERRKVEQYRSALNQQGQQRGQGYLNVRPQIMSNYPTQQDHQEPLMQGFQPPIQQDFQQPQSRGMTSHGPSLQQEVQELEQLERMQELRQSIAARRAAQGTMSQMPQLPMATPPMMSNRGMPSNGVPPYRMNMQESHRQDSPAVGYRAARPFPQNGMPAPMNFTQGSQWTNVQGMSGDFGESVGGADMAQEGLLDFSG